MLNISSTIVVIRNNRNIFVIKLTIFGELVSKQQTAGDVTKENMDPILFESIKHFIGCKKTYLGEVKIIID